MALIAGAGNPTPGSNPTGVGTSINYIGDRVFGYSGSLSIDDTEATMLEFTTGSEIIVAEVQINMLERTGDEFLGQVYLNGSVIAGIQTGNSTNNNEPSFPIRLVIGPYTLVTITADNVSSSGARAICCQFTGRIV